MNRHDLSDKHMRKQRTARQEERNISTEKLDEIEELQEDEEERRWQKDKAHPPVNPKLVPH